MSVVRTPRLSSSSGPPSTTSSQMSAKSPKPRPERNSNFKVVIRVRPPLPRELSGEIEFLNVVAVDKREQMITVSENIDQVVDEQGQVLANPGPFSAHTLFFDHVYDQYASQKKVFDTTARSVVESALQGYNATIFAYGQTGTGKTYTMEGFNQNGNVENRGIIPRAIEQIFSHIQKYASPRMRFLVRASYLQIYNEQISDLLKPERSNLAIREDKKRGVFVDGLSEWVVRSPAEIYGLMEKGGAVRATGETKMNEVSSRSHAVFIIIAEQSETIYVDDNGQELSAEDFQLFANSKGLRRPSGVANPTGSPSGAKLDDHIRQSFKVGKLNLVDLAGSERVGLSGATGQRFEESKQINRSLSALGNVIAALTDSKVRQHIPYRDSKLTRMLEDSLGGNCRTTMMAMISPALEAMVESLSTLKFANRAKNIRNEARVNEDLDQKSLLRKYERELKKLRAELEERSKNVVDMRRLLELDEQRRRAEADKMEAIRALEARSKEFMMEKEEKKKLEQRIAILMNQMIRGEKARDPTQDTAATEIQKDSHEKLRREYENKLAGLERERETIEEEKAQVERYKQLLLKQRDIMIALTQRLVERDEQIMALQEELDAYDNHQKELEEKLDEKTAQLIKLQRISMEFNASSPIKNEELSQAISESELEGGSSGRSNERRRPLSNANNSTGITGAIEVTPLEEDDVASVADSSTSNVIAGSEDADNRLDYGNVRQVLYEELSQQLRRMEEDPKQRDLCDSLSVLGQRLIARLPVNDSPTAKDAENEHYRLENEYLQHRVKDLQHKLDQSSSKASHDLQVRCDTLLKEREAVQTIMEQKIKALVQSVVQSTNSLLASQPSNSSTSGISTTLSKDVAALQRLVNASIAALRNASSQSSSMSGSSATSSSSNLSTSSTGAAISTNPNITTNTNTPGSLPRSQSNPSLSTSSNFPTPVTNNGNLQSNSEKLGPSISTNSSSFVGNIPPSPRTLRPPPPPPGSSNVSMNSNNTNNSNVPMANPGNGNNMLGNSTGLNSNSRDRSYIASSPMVTSSNSLDSYPYPPNGNLANNANNTNSSSSQYNPALMSSRSSGVTSQFSAMNFSNGN